MSSQNNRNKGETSSELPSEPSKVLVLVLAPAKTLDGQLGARVVHRELPRQLVANGLELHRLSFDEKSSSPLAGRDALVLWAKQEHLQFLAEQNGLPKLTDQGRFGTLWQPFSAGELEKFVGADNADEFFSESEVLSLLRHGVLGIPTASLEASCSPKELACLRNARPHHRALRAAEKLGVIEATLAFHDPEKVKELKQRWRPWNPFETLPLNEIAEYFGPQAVHYFVFMQLYAKLVVLPCILGLFVMTAHRLMGSLLSPDSHFSYLSQGSAALVAIWATILVEKWRRTLSITRRNLGYHLDSGKTELLGPVSEDQIQAAASAVNAGRIRGDKGQYRDRVGLRYAGTISAMFLLVGVTTVVIHLLLLVGDIAEEKSDSIIVQNSPLALYMVVVEVLQRVYTRLATWLTDREGHLMQAEYQKSLTMKTAFFQLINYHGWFLYLAFWRQDLDYLRSQLLTFFTIKQVIGNLSEVVLPMLQAAKQTKGTGADEDNKKSSLFRMASGILGRFGSYEELLEEHFALPEPNAFDDYLEMSVMFAALVLYFPVFPLGGLLALFHVLFENSSDAYKWCSVQRRSITTAMDDALVEVWVEIFDAISYLGVCSSVGLIYLENQTWSPLHLVLAEHAVLIFKAYLSWSIPDCPEYIDAFESSCREQMRSEAASQRGSTTKDGSKEPELLEVRATSVSGIDSRWGGLLQRHPVIRLTHGPLDSGAAACNGRSSVASSPGGTDEALRRSITRQELHCELDDLAEGSGFWFSLPFRPGAGLLVEVLSLERSMVWRKPQPIVLGTAKITADQLPTGSSPKDGHSTPKEITCKLTGAGVSSDASISLEFRCM